MAPTWAVPGLFPIRLNLWKKQQIYLKSMKFSTVRNSNSQFRETSNSKQYYIIAALAMFEWKQRLMTAVELP